MADVLKALAIAVLLAPISLPAAAAEVDPHAQHHHEMMQMKRATRSTAAYAKRYKAGPQWRFYTGTPQASVAVQRAFNAYRGDKMNHTPVTFLRAGRGQQWVRIEGFATADELAAELRGLIAAQ